MESKKAYVLYIEDDPGLAILLKKKIEQKGYVVDVARDGKEGLGKFDRNVYDIVLIDYALPDTDGLQLIKVLLSRKRSVPVIMTTGFGSEEVAVQALTLGAHDYLVKDTQANFIDLLPSRIERALQQEQLLTQKQEAEAARKLSEEKLRSILESLDDFVFVIDSNNVIVDVHKPVSLNGEVAFFDECIGKPLGDIFPKEAARMLVDAIEVVKETRTVIQFDFSMDVNDEQRWFNTKVSEYRIGTNEFKGVTVLARDITKRRVLEQTLEENQNRLRILFDYAPDGYFLVDCAGTLLESNKALERILGYKNEELKGKNVNELPIFSSTFLPTIKILFSHEQFETDSEIIELLANRKDGGQVMLELRTHAVTIKGRRMMLGSVRDISARKEAEMQIRYQQNLLSQVFASTPNSLVMKDSNFKYKFVNQAFCDYVGKKEKEVLGKTDFELFPRKEAEYYRQGDLQVLTSKKPLFQRESVTRDGRLLHFSVSKMPILDNRGDPLGLVVSLNDVTELLLSAEELRKAKREAEAANKTKSEFLANISHELRTPLTAIIGFSEIIEKGLAGKITEKQERYVAAIKESGKHLLELINDILDISKIEFGAMRLDLSEVNVRDLIDRSFLMTKTKAEKRNVRINVNVPKKISALRVKADERKLKQILFNLLSNAVKFTPKSGEITVGAEVKEQNLVLYVRDTGIGIAKQEQAKIFNEFYQVKQSIKNQRSGTGLGLSLTKRLVELHGGSIRVRSQGLGKGSRFTCVLPVDFVKSSIDGDS